MKWADFGLSKTVNLRGTFTMSGTRGTLCWMAPEVLNVIAEEEEANGKSISDDSESSPRGTVKSDVFSAGCVFVYYLLEGIHLYGSNQMEIPNNIKNNQPINLESKFRFFGKIFRLYSISIIRLSISHYAHIPQINSNFSFLINK